MIELWVVRHGQTDWNVEGRYQGQTDIPLNEIGRKQAQELAQLLPDLPFAAIHTSDLIRAKTTASILGQRLGLEPIPDVRLREMSHGEWEGSLVRDKIRTNHSNPASPNDPTKSLAPGGESAVQVAQRVTDFANQLLLHYPNQRVLLVTHGVTAAVLKCLAHGIPLDNLYQHIPNNTALLTLLWPPKTF
jgi:broad specificity phosphatase PhoE